MKVKIYDTTGSLTSKSVTLSDDVFGIEPNNHAIYLDVKQHLANRRQGTHKTKERAEIVKSGTRVGGGRIFGPRPRNYHFKLNIKLKRLARKSAFSFKAQNEGLMVLEDLAFANAKTKEFVNLMNALQLSNQKVLLILGDKNDSIYLASRNLGKVKVVTADSVNTFDVLFARKVVMTSSSVGRIEEILN
jgi:large subunit ribosomal protein L4